MPDVILEDDPFVLTDLDKKTYPIKDPLELMMELAGEKLVGEDGTATSDATSLSKIRDKIMKASGIPAITFSNVLRTVFAIGQFAQGLQKKIVSMPNSLPPTDESQPTNPNG